ncbi:hypothetical protein Theco_4040 (plasmid) [Thermobacillus composti KWC4]|uniref:Uncharacterized protein n=1 Tax=Thermobacillus composti (strain DSM 18247 / JCM 13945 / KWC4) TaxID=717605 RepID=L0EKI6_THECK|nr:hypothetical protein [Thermobacillus composti]AGA60042.1 hypothetical protein Theco_4040 [Thermobacillus composti KWC4]
MKNRAQVIANLKSARSLKDGSSYNYVLTHLYDTSPRPVYVKAPYPADIMNALIAFIQYESADIDPSYGLDQEEVAEVLVLLYECEVSSAPLSRATEIDLYINWEEWVNSDIQSISLFQRQQLSEILKRYIEKVGI